MSRTLRVALAQINCLVGDIEGNAELVVARCAEARDRLRADVVAFPELTLTGYPPEDLLLRPALHERVGEALQQIRDSVRGIDVVVGLPIREEGHLYNAAVWLRDGRILGTYHKALLPNYLVFDEKRYFTPGTTPCVVEVQGVRVGLTICEDIWQPGPARQSVEAGAQLIVNINASPYHTRKHREREQVLAARVGDLHVPIVYVNLVGGQDELVFDGESLAMGRDGGLRLRAAAFEEALVGIDFDPASGDLQAAAPVRAPLEETESVYRALILGVRDYVDKNRFPGVVLGLSGGVDSGLTLAVAVDALGPERVHALMMPSRYTAPMSLEDARAEAEVLGVRYDEIPIEPAFNAFLDMLEVPFAGLPRDTTEENIQARIRGVLLMAFSNKFGWMLLTTGNKSEMAVGYATLYGDMAGGFAPLKDVAKTRVYRLAAWRNARSPVIPERVLTRPPSAELAPDQKDTDALPPYEILDPIIERFVEQDQSVDEIVAAGFERETVLRVARMVLVNEYKRRQAPPGVRITRRAFGKDRRYPITSGYLKLLDSGRA
ncbi:MAG TPA: NAD+ synthase [Chromatiales bacterium]|nr:NAD+ synthase [Chromatiales bacterium]